MSLADRLNSITTSTNRRCKLMNVLYSESISKEDRDLFLSLMSAQPLGTPGRVSNVDLAKALREEGYEIADSAVDRHRRGSCSCTGQKDN